MTMSLGQVPILRGKSAEALLNRADECLYQAKMVGCNCVMG